MSDISKTLMYKLLQGVAAKKTPYQSASDLGIDRDELESALNDIELRVLIIDIAGLANTKCVHKR